MGISRKEEKTLYEQLDACTTADECIALYEKHKDELAAVHKQIKENAKAIRKLMDEKEQLMKKTPDFITPFKESVYRRIGEIVMDEP
ncbi:hypothetical protein GCM10023116_46630 [Kistimonas scapharcae]|uniref:Uncharacterized protein n=1 Tax=Kistimonas scapharcae TaxID=1036133 RepID=A0ABP8VAE5_9GAMM